jgi:hypothetical protein
MGILKKETAVDYMFRLLDVLTFGKDNETQNIFNDILQQAKEMEKEQIIAAYREGRKDEGMAYYDAFFERTYEDYYRETYGGDK